MVVPFAVGMIQPKASGQRLIIKDGIPEKIHVPPSF